MLLCYYTSVSKYAYIVRFNTIKPVTNLEVAVMFVSDHVGQSELEMREGDTQTLTCTIEGGVPTPLLSWYRQTATGNPIPLGLSGSRTIKYSDRCDKCVMHASVHAYYNY